MVQTSHRKYDVIRLACVSEVHTFISALWSLNIQTVKSALMSQSSADIKIQSAARREGFFVNFKLSWQKRRLVIEGIKKGKEEEAFKSRDNSWSSVEGLVVLDGWSLNCK